MADITGDGAAAFQRITALLDYPMFVVTTRAGADRAGCLVGFAGQVSIDPPRFMVALSKLNQTYRIAGQASHLAVHLLNRRDRDLATLFGGETGDQVDKFARCAWTDGPEGVPILSGVAAWFAGRVRERLDLGDHVGHVAEPVAGSAPAGLPDLLTYSDIHGLDPGHQA